MVKIFLLTKFVWCFVYVIKPTIVYVLSFSLVYTYVNNAKSRFCVRNITKTHCVVLFQTSTIPQLYYKEAFKKAVRDMLALLKVEADVGETAAEQIYSFEQSLAEVRRVCYFLFRCAVLRD